MQMLKAVIGFCTFPAATRQFCLSEPVSVRVPTLLSSYCSTST